MQDLSVTGIKMWWAAGKEPDLQSNPALKLLRRVLPVAKDFDGEKFFTLDNGRKVATPLIVLTSNIFAILGLRAMYFLLAAVATKFYLLSYGLAVVLVFIGTKMLLIDVVKMAVLISLGVVVSILAITMI